MTKKRYIYIDILNCIAIFSVLMLHSSQIGHFGNPTSKITILGNVIQCIFIPAVYIFFMNSAAMLRDYRKRQSTKTFVKKRTKRVLLPFIVWSFLYYLYDIKWTAFPGPISHIHPSIKDFVQAFATNNINNIFWFFYVIIAIYLTLPIISLSTEKHKKYLWYIVIISFILNDFTQWLGSLTNMSLNNKYLNSQLLNFLAYAIIGYLIKEKYFNRKQENLMIIIGLFAFALAILGTLTGGRIKAISNIGPMLYSVAIVLIVRRVTETHTFSVRTINLFKIAASSSLGMYILHVLFYKVFSKIFNVGMTSLVYIFVMPVIVYIIGTPLIYLLKRNKWINTILP